MNRENLRKLLDAASVPVFAVIIAVLTGFDVGGDSNGVAFARCDGDISSWHRVSRCGLRFRESLLDRGFGQHPQSADRSVRRERNCEE